MTELQLKWTMQCIIILMMWEFGIGHMFTLTITENRYPQVIRTDLCTLIDCESAGNGKEFRVDSLHYYRGGKITEREGWLKRFCQLPRGAPPVISIHQINGNSPSTCKAGTCHPAYITVKHTAWIETGNRVCSLRHEIFGVNMRNGKTECCFRISLDQGATSTNGTRNDKAEKGQGVKIIEVKDLEQAFEIETGYEEQNAWIEWVRYSAQTLKKDNCYACASGRPQAHMEPFPLGWTDNRGSMECMMALYQDATAWGNKTCTALSLMFPPVNKKLSANPSSFLVTVTHHKSCISLSDTGLSKDMGELKTCIETKNVTTQGNYSSLKIPRADIWWFFRGKILRPTLPPQWKGTCALVQLAIPFSIAYERQEERGSVKGERSKRGIPTSFDDSIYLDPVGIPRGVPDEFKARNQIAAGFESLFWWVTINKNVDWINYIYYNQQRFINYTRDAVKGIAEQLDATSRMAWENGLALDMILAEKGGVCVMLKGQCCTFIPNNTAPDGSITRALQGLTTLAEEMADNSGADTSMTGWLESMFAKWKGLIVSILTSVIVVIGALAAIGCCIIPCVRGLVQRLIETALTKQMPLPLGKGGQDTICLLERGKTEGVDGPIEREIERMLDNFGVG
ncbi:uncharacterized protein [Scyliorhinus torazame]|uniref:uncharacterized protein n=1 Tax=Scyliorhinus torazame TaxID=75743 RepID=UPI003B5ACF1F